MGRRAERHLFDEWADKFDVLIQAEVDGLLTFWQFAEYLSLTEHTFLSHEGLRRYMQYMRK